MKKMSKLKKSIVMITTMKYSSFWRRVVHRRYSCSLLANRISLMLRVLSSKMEMQQRGMIILRQFIRKNF